MEQNKEKWIVARLTPVTTMASAAGPFADEASATTVAQAINKFHNRFNNSVFNPYFVLKLEDPTEFFSNLIKDVPDHKWLG